jgi:hypothetical protein
MVEIKGEKGGREGGREGAREEGKADVPVKAPTTSTFFQPGLGVEVMCPYVGEESLGSKGPKVAMPIES